MRYINWVILIGAVTSNSLFAQKDIPKFATKLNLESLRFITRDGKFSYAQKRSGSLSLISDFKTRDIIESPPGTNYLVSSSPSRKKIIVEVERAQHQEFDLNKLHEIWIAPIGDTKFVSVGMGRYPKLHLNDEWLTYYDPKTQSIHIQFLPVAKRHYIVRLSQKHNPYFNPEVLMLTPETILYTDINNKGYSALLSYNLIDNKVTKILKAEFSGTKMELCSRDNYAALGEFSYPGARRGSSIRLMTWKVVAGISGFTEIYRTTNNDLGQMICDSGQIWFVKTISEEKELNGLTTEAATLTIPSAKVEIKTSLQHVNNIIEMDGRILLPLRGETYVLSGNPGSKQDQLQKPIEKQP